MHGSETVKCVFDYAVCLMAMCVVKQAVYSTELQKPYCNCARCDNGYSPVTMYYKAVYTALNQRICAVVMCRV
jgi:hypothetical protein